MTRLIAPVGDVRQRYTTTANPIHKHNVAHEQVDTELFLYPDGSDNVYILNASAALIWTLCDGTRSVEMIVLYIAATCALSIKQARLLVQETIVHFESIGVLDYTERIPGVLPDSHANGNPVLSRRQFNQIAAMGLGFLFTKPVIETFRAKPAFAGSREPPVFSGDADDGSGGITSRPRPQGGPAALKAGEIDDNEQFEAYLEYLDTYNGTPARIVDVSERYRITIFDNNQSPLLDARVRIYADDVQVFDALTYAGGATMFHPRGVGVSNNVQEFRLVAEQGNTSAETTFKRSERPALQETIELAIKDATPPDELRLDVLFLLDTTGSMADELSRIQETIDSIAQRIDECTPRPRLRFGVVAYRDREDEYVTRSYDFTDDVETFRTLLNSFTADGGGDTPESLNEGLHGAVQEMSWAERAVRLVFLVADAGPHLDYEDDYDYVEEIQQALRGGIKIFPIAASNTDSYAEYVFRQLAQQTCARFIFLTYQPGKSGGAPGESTTLDAGEQEYTVDRLDDLIVQVVERELAAATGVA